MCETPRRAPGDNWDPDFVLSPEAGQRSDAARIANDVRLAADDFFERGLERLAVNVAKEILAARDLNQVMLECASASRVEGSHNAGAAIVDQEDFCRTGGALARTSANVARIC